MTENEIKAAIRVLDKEEDQQIDWVTRRSECSTMAVYKAIVARMAEDVKKMNKTSTAELNDCIFHVDDKDIKETKFSRIPKRSKPDAKNIYVCLEGDSIIVKTPFAKNDFVVTHRWDMGSLRCILEVESEEKQLWEISQKALFDLFFGDGQEI